MFSLKNSLRSLSSFLLTASHRPAWALVLGIAVGYGDPALASSVAYVRAQSASQASDKVKLGLGLGERLSSSFSYRRSIALSDMDDKTSDLAKVGASYYSESDHTFAVDLTVSDDVYFFEGKAAALSAGFSLSDIDRVTLGLEVAQKTYTKARAEALIQRTISVGYERDLSDSFTLGVDFATNGYSSQNNQAGSQMTRALAGQTSLYSDLNTYAVNLAGNSFTVFSAYAVGDFDLGAAIGVDTSYLDGLRSSIIDLSADWAFADRWTANVSLSRMRTSTSTTAANGAAAGITYFF